MHIDMVKKNVDFLFGDLSYGKLMKKVYTTPIKMLSFYIGLEIKV